MPAHTIAYAYPTSPAAEKHGFAKTGCYTVAIDGTEKATSTFAQAQGMASQLRRIVGPSTTHRTIT